MLINYISYCKVHLCNVIVQSVPFGNDISGYHITILTLLSESVSIFLGNDIAMGKRMHPFVVLSSITHCLQQLYHNKTHNRARTSLYMSFLPLLSPKEFHEKEKQWCSVSSLTCWLERLWVYQNFWDSSISSNVIELLKWVEIRIHSEHKQILLISVRNQAYNYILQQWFLWILFICGLYRIVTAQWLQSHDRVENTDR